MALDPNTHIIFEGKDVCENLLFFCKHTWESQNVLRPHAHAAYEFIYILAGEGAINAQGIEYSLSGGDLLVVEPFIEHSGVANPDTPFDLFTICYDLNLSQQYFDPILSSMGDLLLRLYRAYTDETHLPLIRKHYQLADVIYKLVDEIVDARIYRKELLRTYLAEIFILLIRGISNLVDTLELGTDTESMETVATARRYMQENFHEPLTLDDIAGEVCLSPSHFCRIFKRATSFTPVEHLNNVRIANAKRLLIYSSISLSEIAYKVGFKSIHYFSRRFKESEGLSPSAFRESKKDILFQR